jgi:hypothetical protein
MHRVKQIKLLRVVASDADVSREQWRTHDFFFEPGLPLVARLEKFKISNLLH